MSFLPGGSRKAPRAFHMEFVFFSLKLIKAFLNKIACNYHYGIVGENHCHKWVQIKEVDTLHVCL